MKNTHVHIDYILTLVHNFCVFCLTFLVINITCHIKPNCCVCAGAGLCFSGAKYLAFFLSPEIAITPHMFVKHSRLGQLCRVPSAPNTSLQERAAQTSSFPPKINSLCHISLGVQLSTLPPTPPALGLVQGTFQERFQLLTLLLFLKVQPLFSQIFFFFNSC